MCQVFMEVGAKELIFIERSGLLFGFIFGCLQTTLWYFYQEDWVLPVGGLVVRKVPIPFYLSAVTLSLSLSHSASFSLFLLLSASRSALLSLPLSLSLS